MHRGQFTYLKLYIYAYACVVELDLYCFLFCELNKTISLTISNLLTHFEIEGKWVGHVYSGKMHLHAPLSSEPPLVRFALEAFFSAAG